MDEVAGIDLVSGIDMVVGIDMRVNAGGHRNRYIH